MIVRLRVVLGLFIETGGGARLLVPFAHPGCRPCDELLPGLPAGAASDIHGAIGRM